jgi:hypothetical protein
VSLLALSLTIQMYQICIPKVPRILNPTYHLTLSQTETYILCVDLINNYCKTILSKLKSGHKYIQYSTIIIKCNFFPYLYYYDFGTALEFPLFFSYPQKYPPHPLVNTLWPVPNTCSWVIFKKIENKLLCTYRNKVVGWETWNNVETCPVGLLFLVIISCPPKIQHVLL